MKLIVCAIKDHAIDAFLAPWYARTEAEATRIFLQSFQMDTPMAKSPADYDLFKLGSWDDHNAKHADADAPILLARGSNAKPNGEDKQTPFDLDQLHADPRN